MAGLPAAVRSGLLQAVRLLVVLAYRMRLVGIVALRVAVHRGAGPVGRRGEGVPEAAQPLRGEIEGFHVGAGLLQGRSAVRSTASCGPGSGSWSSCSESAAVGGSSCSGIAACWWATTSYPRPRTAVVVVRSFSLTTAPARTARSYCSGRRGISHSPAV